MIYITLFDDHSGYTEARQNGMEMPNVSFCQNQNEVHYKDIKKYNGYQYIDLGLPSGTMWAACNLGASSPEQTGLWFQWADTSGYTEDKNFDWDTYKYYDENEPLAINSGMTKYHWVKNGSVSRLTGRVLEESDDMVNVNMGGNWRTPTQDQFSELARAIRYIGQKTVVNGVSGVSVTSDVTGDSIFFPYTGIHSGNTVVGGENSTCYWGSVIRYENYQATVTQASGIYIGDITIQVQDEVIDVNGGYLPRCVGSQVRGVYNPYWIPGLSDIDEIAEYMTNYVKRMDDAQGIPYDNLPTGTPQTRDGIHYHMTDPSTRGSWAYNSITGEVVYVKGEK